MAHDPDAPDSATAGAPFLVVVDQSVDPHVVVHQDPRSHLAEQYRSFRTNLVALNSENAPRALALTSAIKGEGKSVTVANLAAALVELPDIRVVVVDADLRQPRQSELLGSPASPGLADLLLDGQPLEAVCHQTTLPNLSVIPAGRVVNNPSELLGSARMGDLVRELKKDHHYLLFDTPPVLHFSDATVLGGRMDGAMLVVRMDQTSREQVERSLKMLRSARVNVLGTFLAGSRALSNPQREYVLEDE